MKTYIPLILFIPLAVIQLAVPASMIVRHEATLQEGTVFLFHTAPVDPYDPFRGRYVRLRLEPDSGPAPDGARLERKETVYAVLEADTEGFAQVKEVSRTRPQGNDYIRARVGYVDGDGNVTLKWPIDRYYMDEDLAPEAERAMRRNTRREMLEAHVSVRVRRGHAVLEELFIEGTPVVEYVRAELAATETE